MTARSFQPYAELCATSNFTFLTGASHPEELVTRAAELGLSAIAITDRNSVAGVVRAFSALKELARLRDEGKSLADVMAQGALFGSDISPEAMALMEFLEENIRSPQRIAQFIENYLTAVESFGTPVENHGDMFGGKQAPSKQRRPSCH